MIVKVCGMRSPQNIREIEQSGADLMGFIFFARSPRYVDSLPSYMPESCQRVGVFVNETTQVILDRAAEFKLDYIQLHGKESPEQCREISGHRLKVIKVFSVASSADLAAVDLYEGLCDYFLFDTACAEHGGSGRSFNWGILKEYAASTPFLLSGGIGSHSVESIKNFSHPRLAGLDINSGFEVEPALKDAAKVSEFIKQIKK